MLLTKKNIIYSKTEVWFFSYFAQHMFYGVALIAHTVKSWAVDQSTIPFLTNLGMLNTVKGLTIHLMVRPKINLVTLQSEICFSANCA